MKYDVIVIGAGPGGYIAALTAAAHGLNVAVCEKEHAGGTCLNWGCIPTKALLASAKVYKTVQRASEFGISIEGTGFNTAAIMTRKDKIVLGLRSGIENLFKSYGVSLYKGTAEITGVGKVKVRGETDTMIEADNIIIATGSVPAGIGNVQLNGKTVISSNEALNLEKFPESVVIIGGGVIGVEFATVFGVFGAQVTIVELAKNIIPFEDKSVSARLKPHLKKLGVEIITGCSAQCVEDTGNGVKITLDNGKTVEAELCMVSVGRKRVIEGIGLENAGVDFSGGIINVDENCRTNVPGIYAIGDAASRIMLAHYASAQGRYVAELIAGKNPHMPDFVPACIYTFPEIASFGKNETQLKEEGVPFKTGMFSYRSLGKALAAGEEDGMVKLYASEDGKILGASIIGEKATDMIHEIIVAAENNVDIHALGNTIHAHPTFSESVMEAAHDVFNLCVHAPKKNSNK